MRLTRRHSAGLPGRLRLRWFRSRSFAGGSMLLPWAMMRRMRWGSSAPYAAVGGGAGCARDVGSGRCGRGDRLGGTDRAASGPDAGGGCIFALARGQRALGAVFMLMIDTVCRALGETELPPGVLAALLGAPVLFLLMRRGDR